MNDIQESIVDRTYNQKIRSLDDSDEEEEQPIDKQINSNPIRKEVDEKRNNEELDLLNSPFAISIDQANPYEFLDKKKGELDQEDFLQMSMRSTPEIISMEKSQAVIINDKTNDNDNWYSFDSFQEGLKVYSM